MALVQNPRFARWFAKYGARNEARGNARLRAELLDGLTGTVLEVGAGTGLNLLATLRASGFEVVRWRAFDFPPGARFSLVGPRIHGVAVPR